MLNIWTLFSYKMLMDDRMTDFFSISAWLLLPQSQLAADSDCISSLFIYIYISDFQWVQLYRLPEQTPQHPVWERGRQPAVRPHCKTADEAALYIPEGLSYSSITPPWCYFLIISLGERYSMCNPPNHHRHPGDSPDQSKTHFTHEGSQ